jgi:hypothetical protein
VTTRITANAAAAIGWTDANGQMQGGQNPFPPLNRLIARLIL